MKKHCLILIVGLFIILLVSFILWMTVRYNWYSQSLASYFSASGQNKPYVVRAIGRVRSSSNVTLRNKFPGFVSKINFYSQRRVKKGDVILEYDDYELRVAIQKLEHSITEQKLLIEEKKLNLELVRLNPLPSEYRNLHWKRRIAQENLTKTSHTFNVYKKLHGSKIVADLDYLDKKEAFINAEAELKKIDNDMQILKKGLAALYIRKAEAELADAVNKLQNLETQLKLRKEEQKYYKIVSPCKGTVITYSNVVHGYYSAGTSAAVVHRDGRKDVYAYFRDRDLRYIHEGMTLRFKSNQYPPDMQGAEVKIHKINCYHTVYGDQSYFLVESHVTKEPYPLRIDSAGTLEATVDPKDFRAGGNWECGI